ncbi:MAG: hypothetical protein ACJAUP_002062 [Cellvibrionaceae bacterium]|jgi:hypothetical protein
MTVQKQTICTSTNILFLNLYQDSLLLYSMLSIEIDFSVIQYETFTRMIFCPQAGLPHEGAPRKSLLSGSFITHKLPLSVRLYLV